MGNGWIKLHRDMLKWEWYDDINTKCLFIHCLLRANHSDGNWRGIEVKRGSFITSLESLVKETKLSTSQIRTAIRKLESTGEIASLSQARNRVVTVLKYEMYQGNDKVNDSVIAGSSQDDDKVVATNKNVKNENNEKNGIKTINPKLKFSDDDMKCAEFIRLGISRLLPNSKEPNFNTWAEAVRKIRVIDGKDHKEICELFKFANNDGFWQTNILSPDKLRKKWDQLEAKKLQGGSNAGFNNTAKTGNSDLHAGDLSWSTIDSTTGGGGSVQSDWSNHPSLEAGNENAGRIERIETPMDDGIERVTDNNHGADQLWFDQDAGQG